MDSEDAGAAQDLAQDTAADLDRLIERAEQFRDGFPVNDGDRESYPPMTDPAARARVEGIIEALRTAKAKILRTSGED